MKITKENLQKLIKEELELVLSERSLLNEKYPPTPPMNVGVYRGMVLGKLDQIMEKLGIKSDSRRGPGEDQSYGRD